MFVFHKSSGLAAATKKLQKSYEGRCLISLVAERLSQGSAPKIPSSFSNGVPENLGYVVLGPLVVGFCQWIASLVDTYDIPQLLFLSRDTRICFNSWHILYPNTNVETHYVLSSRRAVSTASIVTLDDALKMIKEINFSRQSIKEFFESRFSFNLDESYQNVIEKSGLKSIHHSVKHPNDIQPVQLLVKELWDELKEYIVREREAYLSYLSSKKIQNDSAIIDLGCGGTIQKYLSLITNKTLRGIYLGTFKKIARLNLIGLPTHGYIISKETGYSNHPFVRNIPLLEHIFLDQEKSLICFKKVNNQLEASYFSPEEKTYLQRIALVSRIQAGAIDFVQDWQNKFGNELTLQDPSISFEFFRRMVTKPTKEDALVFSGQFFEDNYSKVTKITKCLLAAKNEFVRGNYRKAIKSSQWKTAAYLLAGRSLQFRYRISKLKRTCKSVLRSVFG